MTKQSEIGIIRTKMSAALIAGMAQCIEEGRNPGRIGHRILTNKAAGVGVKFVPRPKPKSNTLHMKRVAAAVSADKETS